MSPDGPACGRVAGGGASRLVYHTKSLPVSGPALLSEHSARQGDYPVERVDIYRRDCVTQRTRIVGCKPKWMTTKEGGQVIREFTDRSMRRGIHVAKNCDCDFLSMITLTYPLLFPTDGRRVKANLEAFRVDYLARYGTRGLWWLEFQRRGAPHFHILCEENLDDHGPLVWRTRRSKRGPGHTRFQTCEQSATWLAERWYCIVGSKDPKHLKAGTAWEVIEAEEGAWVYMAAHAGKRKQKVVPDGFIGVGRFWGKIGDLKVEKVGTCKATTADVFAQYGHAALSSKGKVKKYLYDGAPKFSADDL